MGIFNQQPNYNQSYTKEKRGITGSQGPPGPSGPAGAQGIPGPTGAQVSLDLMALKVLLVYQALVLISHQMGILIWQTKK